MTSLGTEVTDTGIIECKQLYPPANKKILCAEALAKVKDKQAEIYRTTGRVPHKGQVINFLLQGK